MQHHDRCIQGHDHQIDSKPLRMARAISGTPYESSGPPVASGKLAVTLPVLSRSSGQVVKIALRCKTYLPAQQTQLQMLAKDILRSTVKLAYIVYFACCQLQISFGGWALPFSICTRILEAPNMQRTARSAAYTSPFDFLAEAPGAEVQKAQDPWSQLQAAAHLHSEAEVQRHVDQPKEEAHLASSGAHWGAGAKKQTFTSPAVREGATLRTQAKND